MARSRISRFLLASIFLILLFLLIVVYFSDLNPNVNLNQEAKDTTIKKLNENTRDYVGEKVRITGAITSSEGDYMIIADKGEEFVVTNPGSLKRGNNYEIEGIVKSRPLFMYRYYKINYYIDVIDIKEI